MTKVAFLLAIITALVLLSGCETVYDDARQTGKNVKSVFLGGYSKDLYTAQ